MLFFIKSLNTRSLSALASLFFLLNACKNPEAKSNTLFSQLDNTKTHIHFKNSVKENLYFNFINYSYIYNGGGVAVGDINNDGLDDLYFTSNQGSNKLYLNEGNFKFKDITEEAKVADNDGWTTGTTMIDINNDGWLDIYVCKSGALKQPHLRKNKLYINQKNGSFIEQGAKYGIDHFGFSVQAYFFDYDNDDDLDLYLVNHRNDFINNTVIDPNIQNNKEAYNSDQLFKNEGSHFINVTEQAGVLNKAWGLSASIGDFNNDTLLDIYVANDFLEPDFLYINQGNGTFKDEIKTHFSHIPSNSMGSDFADLNNDLKPDLVVLDMMAEDHIRGKQNMATMSTENFNLLVKNGYHHQYMSNMLQLNNGDGSYSEIGQLAGIAKTDWSWSPLIADFDNDGYNDLFVTNGIQNDLSNQDFRTTMKKNIMNRKKVSLDEAINMMPSNKLSNYAFKNNSDLTFKNTTKTWGLDAKINSNGSAYADLDNDGDLDLIINNQAEEATIYKNNSQSNYIAFSLKGNKKNKHGIGAEIQVYSENLKQSKRLFVSRGFQSSISNKLHFGLGNSTKIDSVKVLWQNGNTELISAIESNATHTIDIKNSTNQAKGIAETNSVFETINPSTIGIDFLQKENLYDDFKLQLLLPQKQSEFSAPITVGDVNNDGLDDFFVGNAKDETASLYLQNKNGDFSESNQNLFSLDKKYEDTNAKFIDVDQDNDLDLVVTSGGYEIEDNSPLLQDRLYINNGTGIFTKGKFSTGLTHSKSINFTDYDGDGDQDIFIGNRVKHGKYPLSDAPHFLENNNGKFKDVTATVFDAISELQIINDAVFSDYDNDGDDDLIVVGEWMPITIYENENSKFKKQDIPELSNKNGWYQSITASDLDKDGDIDYVIGNWGKNNKFHPSSKKPLHIYADYFDDNDSFDTALSKVSKTGDLLPVRGKECSSQQTPFLNSKLKTFNAFANATMPDIYGQEKLANATHLLAHEFKSFILRNNGNKTFNIEYLPNEAQFSPTLSTVVEDVNNDGFLDIIGVGNVYDAEVETIRYDASKGYVLFGDADNNYTAANTRAINKDEAKSITKITINNAPYFIILNKNAPLNLLKLSPKPL